MQLWNTHVQLFTILRMPVFKFEPVLYTVSHGEYTVPHGEYTVPHGEYTVPRGEYTVPH